jgi:hypothetical protein
MNSERPLHRPQTADADVSGPFVHEDRQCSIQLARLILADEPEEGCAYRLFARGLAHQIQHWNQGVLAIGEDDVVTMLRSAARELLAEHWEE